MVDSRFLFVRSSRIGQSGRVVPVAPSSPSDLAIACISAIRQSGPFVNRFGKNAPAARLRFVQSRDQFVAVDDVRHKRERSAR
jgi:hypothetical protein